MSDRVRAQRLDEVARDARQYALSLMGSTVGADDLAKRAEIADRIERWRRTVEPLVRDARARHGLAVLQAQGARGSWSGQQRVRTRAAQMAAAKSAEETMLWAIGVIGDAINGPDEVLKAIADAIDNIRKAGTAEGEIGFAAPVGETQEVVVRPASPHPASPGPAGGQVMVGDSLVLVLGLWVLLTRYLRGGS
ncbi:hypothetical protein JQC91_00010 [Jannaschia sp. Os4]|uniref:hypothetical protein n=1 Tax=Jannaschia sp. Os4 TaxID=2807617 RepID=UPI0019395A11|nr:hypothetical protein [Jannaschia sp. Os4]MBM2574672.1 hypothetical protein [Jannaschia sp. Os4]